MAQMVVLNPPRKKRRSKMRKSRRRSSNRRRSSRRRRSKRRNYSHWIPAYRNPKRRRSRRKSARRRTRRRKKNAYYTPRYALNPRRRKRRTSYRYKSRRRRSKRKNYSHWIPAYRNPNGVLGVVTAGLSPKLLAALMPAAAGAIVNPMVSGWAATRDWMPSGLRTGAGKTVLNLMSAGVSGTLAGFVNRRWGVPVFIGGVFAALVEATNRYIVPAVTGIITPEQVAEVEAQGDMKGLDDYLSVDDARRAQALGSYYSEYGDAHRTHPGLGSWLVPQQDQLDPRLGDFLTVEDARRARPLGQITTTPLDYPSVDDVAENIAAMDLASQPSGGY